MNEGLRHSADSSKLQNNEGEATLEASLSAEQSIVIFRQAFIPKHNGTNRSLQRCFPQTGAFFHSQFFLPCGRFICFKTV